MAGGKSENMFRPIRRKEKERDLTAAHELLKTERRGVLAVNGDDGYPYAVPVNFLFDENENKIYIHGSKFGHKNESIKKCDKVCFTVYGSEQIKKEEWAPFLTSVVIFGRCRLPEQSDKTAETLKKLATKYYPDENSVNEEIAKFGAGVQMYEITIEHITAKEIQEK